MSSRQQAPLAATIPPSSSSSPYADVSLVLFKQGILFAKKHSLLTVTYILGLLLFQFAQGWAVTPEMQQGYEKALLNADLPRVFQAREEVQLRSEDYRSLKGWFSCNEQCLQAKSAMLQAQSELEAAEMHNAAALSEARARVGVFSEYGIQDARTLFWDCYEAGRGFVKRASMMDALFLSINMMQRDESLISVVVNWLFSLAVNFTIGMIGAFVGFAWQMWALLTSYQAGWPAAILFFSLALAAAFSVLVSFIIGLYLTAATTVYVAVKASVGYVRISAAGNNNGRRIAHVHVN